MRNIFLLIAICFITIIYSQGNYNVYDSVYDGKGNKYSLNSIALKQINPGINLVFAPATVTCQAGYFRLFFAPNSGLDGNTPVEIAKRNVFCQLMTDISCFITSPLNSPCNTTTNTTTFVNLYITNTTVGAGNASAIYVFPQGANPNVGIIHNAIWKTIVTGTDAYQGVSSPLGYSAGGGFYHGYMRINNTLNWYLNLSSTTAIVSGQADLYTVMLHEALHSLGFESLIGPTGASLYTSLGGPNAYSKYDSFLKDGLGNSLLSAPSSSCSNVAVNFAANVALVNPNNCVAPMGVQSNLTNCATTIFYASPSQTVQLYRPDCYELGASLSHFEDACYPTAAPYGNDMYFVMSNILPGSVVRRYPREEERIVLCDLGYSVTANYPSPVSGAAYSYTAGACTPDGVWGVNDGLDPLTGAFTFTWGASNCVTIPKSTILANDAANSSISCVSFVTSGGGAFIVDNPSDIQVCFPPGPLNFCGPMVLQYVPKNNSTGALGNITYIFVYKQCTNCGPVNPCNIVQNGGFENVNTPSVCVAGGPNGNGVASAFVQCWDVYNATGSNDLFPRTCPLLPTATSSLFPSNFLPDSHNGIPNNVYAGHITNISTAGVSPSETFQNNLGTPLIPTNTYVVSFWSYFNAQGALQINPGPQPNHKLIYTIGAKQTFPFPFFNGAYHPPTLEVLANFTLQPIFNQWVYNTQTVVFNPSVNAPYNAVTMGGNELASAIINGVSGLGYSAYTFLDDFSIIPAAQVPAFNIPNLLCNATPTLGNIQQFAAQPGTFSGIGIVNNGGVYDFNAPNTLTPGIYPIGYTYTSNVNCVNTIYSNAYVGGITATTNSNTCSGGGYTLSATGFSLNTNFTWLPGGQTSNIIIVNPLVSTVYTLVASSGTCSNQYTFAINIFPLSTTVTPLPPVCVGTISNYTLNSYLSPGTPLGGTFNGPGILQQSCTPPFTNCFLIDLTAPPTYTPGFYSYTYNVPANPSVGNFCPYNSIYNAQFLPQFTLNVNALPSGTNCIVSGQSTTLIATASPSAGVTFSWQPFATSGINVVLSPTSSLTYTLIGDNGGCVKSLTNNINVIPPVTFTNLPTNWCTYQTYYLEDYLAAGTPTGGTWSGTNMGTFYQNQIFGGTNIDVNPVLTSLGTQTVTYCYTSPTNSLCSVCNQFTVNINQGFQLNASSSAVFCANISTLQANIGVAVTFSGSGNPFPVNYLWTPSGLTTASINVTPAANTNYTCIATSVAGCTAVNTVSVSVSNSCCVSTNYLSSSIIGAPGSTTSLTGFFAVNQNITLDGLVELSGEYAIAPNVKITVAPNATLQTVTLPGAQAGAHLYACGDMWQGIEIINTGKVFINTGGDVIEDAIVAVRSNGSTTTNTLTPDITIIGTILNRNRVGVSIENYTQPVNPAPFIIENTVFTCRDLAITPGTGIWPFAGTLKVVSGSTNALSSPYLVGGYTPVNLKPPFSNIPSYAGVYVENSGTIANPVVSPTVTSVLIGNKTFLNNGFFNLFDNLMFGIYGEGSNIESQNNTFQNSRRVILCTPRCRIRGGYGIYAKSNYTTYSNNVLNCTHPSLASNNGRINKFYDCYIGVGADYMYNVDVQYADFRSNQYTSPPSPLNITGLVGVQINTNKVKAYKVSFILMQNIYNGIAANLSPYFMALPGVPAYGLYLGQASVNSNTIVPKLAATAAAGVPRVYHAIYAANGFYSGLATYTESLADFRIQKNTLGNVWRGVQVIGFNFGGYVATVAQNSINMVVDPNTQPQYGVYSAANYANAINTNSISGFNITNTLVAGVYASMNSGPTNTAIALNSIRCNTLTNMFIGFDFESYNGASIWRNNDMQTIRRGLYIGNNGIIGQQGTFAAPSDNKWLGSWAGRNGTWTDATMTSTNPVSAHSKLFVRSGTPNTPPFNNGFIALGSYQAPSALNPANNSAPAFNCLTGGSGGGGGGGSNASQREALLTDIAVENVSVTTIEPATREILRNAAYSDLIAEPVLVTANSTLSAFSATNSMPSAMGKFKDVEGKLSTGQLSLAQSIIAAFSPTTNIENNYKTFYTLQRAYLQNQDLTLLENIQLLLLVYQCPFTDGQVVYNARALYNLVNQTVVVYNDNNCRDKGYSFGRTQDSAASYTPEESELLHQLITNEKETKLKYKTKNEYYLVPNPANTFVSIIGTNEKEQLQITITDVSGKVLKAITINTEAYSAVVNFNLLEGVYFVNIINSHGEKTVKKLVVAKQ